MQITDKLNSDQRFCPDEIAEHIQKVHPIIAELSAEGYDVDFYEVSGFGGLTIVPSMKRARVKVNVSRMQSPLYVAWLFDKLQSAYDSRLSNKEFLKGKKLSAKFPPPRKAKQNAMS